MSKKNETLDVRAMLCGDINRLRYINRYSTCHVVHHENVAEHIFYVAWYAMCITSWWHTNANKLTTSEDFVESRQDFWESLGQVMTKVLVHDIDEAKTGDFFRPFKYSSEPLRQALHNGASLAAMIMTDQTFKQDGECERFHIEWTNAKDMSYAGRIVAFADYLSALSYMVQEIAISNNTMKEHIQTMLEYAHTFDDNSFDFIRPLIDDAHTILEEHLR